MDLRKIDRLVHTKIMGWEESPYIAGYFREGAISLDLPHYSSSFAEAWPVVEKMKEARFSIRKRFIDELQREVTPEETKNRGNLIDAGWMIFFLTPKAICVAALKAVGVEVEEEE
ncbi:BC1872 family protein [Parageobacillus galactosidasius]|uniref:Phage ABA sandwich domain-containing protein n=1 Tax=Parageobacillus galactosidasius TaxID=883812 RepID=A0A226QS13_9BACL|nr:hypothetical protein [Parageobacillus galactosidasius]OXB94824.1 hypothetical protein B9L23_08150 [Parageobacillus galactosidasius]